mmetsp:Transcript_87994/g.284879  ORF Transcript_87994/g.284879 Transcript_87994/m.284879 type:complete len:399 (+) Transcript_87994:268-1464(+)
MPRLASCRKRAKAGPLVAPAPRPPRQLSHAGPRQRCLLARAAAHAHGVGGLRPAGGLARARRHRHGLGHRPLLDVHWQHIRVHRVADHNRAVAAGAHGQGTAPREPALAPQQADGERQQAGHQQREADHGGQECPSLRPRGVPRATVGSALLAQGLAGPAVRQLLLREGGLRLLVPGELLFEAEPLLSELLARDAVGSVDSPELLAHRAQLGHGHGKAILHGQPGSPGSLELCGYPTALFYILGQTLQGSRALGPGLRCELLCRELHVTSRCELRRLPAARAVEPRHLLPCLLDLLQGRRKPLPGLGIGGLGLRELRLHQLVLARHCRQPLLSRVVRSDDVAEQALGNLMCRPRGFKLLVHRGVSLALHPKSLVRGVQLCPCLGEVLLQLRRCGYGSC